MKWCTVASFAEARKDRLVTFVTDIKRVGVETIKSRFAVGWLKISAPDSSLIWWDGIARQREFIRNWPNKDRNSQGTWIATVWLLYQSRLGAVQMRNIFLTLAAITLLLSFNVLRIQAQTNKQDDKSTPRFEVGGQLYGLSLSNMVGDAGVGGRFTYNFNPFVAVDTEVNASLYVGDETIGVNGALVFAGVKVGPRFNKAGIFAKARPGFTTSFTRDTGPGFSNSERVTKPALDLGVVLEYYPSKHSVVRFDVSDVIIGFGNDLIEEVRCPCPRRVGTKNGLYVSVGYSFRF